jgi:hypothetical protein
MPFRREDNIGEPDLWVPPPYDTPQATTISHSAITSIEEEVSAIQAYEIPIVPLTPPPVRETVVAVKDKIPPKVETPSGRGLPVRWLAIGGTAAVVVAAVAMMMPHSSKSQQSVNKTAGSDANTVPTTPSITTAQPTGPNTSSSGDNPTPPRSEPDVPSRREGVDTRQKHVPNDDSGQGSKKPETPRPGGLFFSPEEINRLITQAEKDSGDGKFDDAIGK